jgi:hypothetical protein
MKEYENIDAVEEVLGKSIVVVSFAGRLLCYDLLNNLTDEDLPDLKAFLRKTPVPLVSKPLVLPPDDEASAAISQ